MDSTTAISSLEKLVRYLANLNVNNENIMMSYDDIVSELNEEIIKGLRYYSKRNLPDDDILNLLRRMCYNRIGELKYRYYVTGRKSEVNSLSLDLEIEVEIYTDEGDPEELFDSSSRVNNTYSVLRSEAAKRIFETIILGKEFSSGVPDPDNKRIYNHMSVVDIAAIAGLTTREAGAGIREIKNAYSKVVRDDKN